MYWNESEECQPTEQLRRRQTENLQKTVARVYERVPFYRRRMEDQGVAPDEIESAIGLHAVVRLVEPKTIERSMGKRKRVIDLRKEPKP